MSDNGSRTSLPPFPPDYRASGVLLHVTSPPRLAALATWGRPQWHGSTRSTFVRQGRSAHDPEIVASYPAADLTVERIGNLFDYDFPALLAGQRRADSSSPPLIRILPR